MSSISLLKQKAGIVLEKKKLTNVVARVGLVLDISGSMRGFITVFKNIDDSRQQ